MENELEKAIENKFFCPTKFAQQIEELVQINIEMNYIDAIVYFCEQNSVDLESVLGCRIRRARTQNICFAE